MAEDIPASAEPTTDRDERFAWLDRSLATLCLGSVIIVLVAGFVQVRFGTYDMSWGAAFSALTDEAIWFNRGTWEAFLLGERLPEGVSIESRIVWAQRVPRVVVAVFVGMNLAVSGAIFQAVTRNELASPFILGVSSGAGLMILLTLVVLSGFTLVIPLALTTVTLTTSALLPLFAALGGIVAFGLVYMIAWKNGTSPVRLVLAGVVVGMVFTSLQRALFFFAQDIAVVQQAIAWTTGSITGVQWEEVRIILPSTVVAMGIALLSARQLNVLLLGEKTASSLGMNVERTRFALSAVAVLAAAASIASWYSRSTRTGSGAFAMDALDSSPTCARMPDSPVPVMTRSMAAAMTNTGTSRATLITTADTTPQLSRFQYGRTYAHRFSIG